VGRGRGEPLGEKRQDGGRGESHGEIGGSRDKCAAVGWLPAARGGAGGSRRVVRSGGGYASFQAKISLL
jgi:hypothetical protein